MNLLIRVAYQLFGDPKKNSLEHRLFNSITFINGLINIIGSLGTFYLDNFILLFSLTFGTGIIFLIMYYFSRVKNIYYVLFWPLNITIIIFLITNWIFNGGSLGGSHYYLIPALVIATILLKKRNVAWIYLVYAVITALLFLFEYNFPNYIIFTEKKFERLLDVGSNYIFVQILTGILIFVLSRNLNIEREKSDRLLLNILPSTIAEELKKNDLVIPKRFESVSVLFSDMKGFTGIAERMSPEELVGELDSFFTIFDEYSKKYHLEKIKTIGDAYMLAGGLPMENKTHAIDCVLCGLNIQKYVLNEINRKKKLEQLFWELRLGIHTGSVVAGVIGKQKFAYDIWGDTVNTASRMESSGIPGAVNISESTYHHVKNLFYCEPRGKIYAKNKGEIEMYIVHGIRLGFHVDNEPFTPNAKFWVEVKNLSEN